MNPKFEEAQFFHFYWCTRLKELSPPADQWQEWNYTLWACIMDRIIHWMKIMLQQLSLENPPA